MSVDNGIRIEYMPLSDLIQRYHPRNPKAHNLTIVSKLIRRFGYVTPGVLDEATGKFAEGHGRTKALVQMKERGEAVPERIKLNGGEWLVPVVRGIAFEDGDELLAFLVGSNQATIEGDWNNALLAEVLSDVRKKDKELLDATGFDENKLKALLAQITLPDEFPEYDEDIADDVKMATCPHCGQEFPL